MLRRRPVNLNLQSSTATILLISSILQSGVDLTQIFVDTVGDPESYKKLLQSNFPKHKHIEWVVTSKADSIYPIVGAASICAKVTRDKAMEEWQFGERGVGGVRVEVGEEEEDEEEESVNVKGKGKAKAKAKENGNGKAKRKVEELESQDSGTVSSSRSSQTSELNSDSQTISINRDRVWNLGSGYPGDPKTIQYLKDSIDLIFGFTGIVRFSWSTVKLLLGTPDSSSSSFSKGKAPAIGGASADFKPKSKACKVRWIDEPVPISRFFGGNPTAVKGMGKGMGMISEKEKRSREWRDGNERLKKERSGLWRDLGIGNVGPGGFGF